MNRIVGYHFNATIDEINCRWLHVGFNHAHPEGFHQITAKLFTTFTKIIFRHQNDTVTIIHRFATNFRYRFYTRRKFNKKIYTILSNCHIIATRLSKFLYIIATHFVIHNCCNNRIRVRIAYLLRFNHRFWTQTATHIYS